MENDDENKPGKKIIHYELLNGMCKDGKKLVPRHLGSLAEDISFA